ncbi:hypothetical protein SKAU_G00214240 [Synaphobranchus kaupii]|uniref:Uncharacterized protein n=1 Tax=Synaphobranchus kaupii TaxID=118154 RepID=A0A9Q1F9S2_SYNKA|nr:hypothetical protein SKAU_G00214240 [Synaphobranchus kaupii]
MALRSGSPSPGRVPEVPTCFIAPFKIPRQINPVAYQLLLPRSMQVHLRPYLPLTTSPLKSINSLQAASTAHEARLAEVENCAVFCENTANELLTKYNKLKSEVTDLQNICDDLKGRQRRNYIRVLGLPEGVEGLQPTEFMAELLKKVLQLEEKTVLDHTHRLLKAKPKDGEPPRPLVIRVHHFQTKELILCKAKQAAGSRRFWGGNKISIFPDLASAVAKKRAVIRGVREG